MHQASLTYYSNSTLHCWWAALNIHKIRSQHKCINEDINRFPSYGYCWYRLKSSPCHNRLGWLLCHSQFHWFEIPPPPSTRRKKTVPFSHPNQSKYTENYHPWWKLPMQIKSQNINLKCEYVRLSNANLCAFKLNVCRFKCNLKISQLAWTVHNLQVVTPYVECACKRFARITSNQLHGELTIFPWQFFVSYKTFHAMFFPFYHSLPSSPHYL